MTKSACITALAVSAVCGAFCTPALAAPYPDRMMLHGAPVSSEKLSGYRGTAFTLAIDDGEQAMAGISSVEKSDNPCWVWIGTESINDAARGSGEIKNLCGDNPSSSTIKAEYRDDMYFGPRVFVTGVRVCTNNKETRVKGFQLRGKQILDDGRLGALEYDPSDFQIQITGGQTASNRNYYVNNSRVPADYRTNCQEWHAWADCPSPSQVAIGVVAHFETGKTPRSLTGLELRCRYVSEPYVATGDR